MNKEELAKLITGNEYGSETTKEIQDLAKENNLVIVYGYSDDNIEFEGAVREEIGMYEGGEIYIGKDGWPEFTKDGDITDSKNKIDCQWSPDDLDCSWKLTATFPFASFDIMEDGDLFCRGFVFEIKELLN